MNTRMRNILVPMVTFLVVLAIWQAVVSLGNYSDYLLPTPLLVGEGIRELVRDGQLWSYV